MELEVRGGIEYLPDAVVIKCIINNPIKQTPTLKQAEFMKLACRDVLFGGSASPGKSSGLLMSALMFCDVAGYSALIVRRHFADLKLPGGLIDRSLEWLRGTGAHWNAQENRWRFRSGATLQFGYADKDGDEGRYHGSEYQFIGLDEAVQFSERQIKFFAGERLRRQSHIPVPLRFRCATTPGGQSHEFLRRRYINPGTPGKVFLPATIDDNPHVNRDEYIQSLEEVDPFRRRQMLDGDWNAIEGGRFKREWLSNTWRREGDYAVLSRWNPATTSFEEAERFNWKGAATFQTCDPAASTGAAADHFVLSTWKVTPGANLVWWGCCRDKFEIDQQVRECQSLYRRHKPQFVGVEVVLNQRALFQLLKKSLNPVMVVKPLDPMGRDKLNRAVGAINLAATGRLFLPESAADFPLDEVRSELLVFTGTTSEEASDATDTLAYAVECLPQVRAGGVSSASKRPFIHTTRSKSHLDGLR